MVTDVYYNPERLFKLVSKLLSKSEATKQSYMRFLQYLKKAARTSDATFLATHRIGIGMFTCE